MKNQKNSADPPRDDRAPLRRTQAPAARLARSWARDGSAWLQSRFPALPPTLWPAAAMLVLASAAAMAIWTLRALLQQRWHFAFLPWNLLLAWMPLIFAAATLHLARACSWRSFRPWLAGFIWLLFLPNAPYLVTDLTHLRAADGQRYWSDLIVILFFAWPGVFAGSLSLQLIHTAVAKQLGFVAGWLFAGTACGLAALGVYIGRFHRWNSWDLVFNPVDLLADFLHLLGHPPSHPAHRFSVLFGLLLFLGYVTIQSLPRLPGLMVSLRDVPER